ncbi:hypothetical protein K492DRAFT_200407 [Lichtheimia hyalospora FSU 10163]|nr:hypothetical protein K492DRAFT_200407 [Lichtheimia hyalospora FSU 10163]
MRYWQQCFRRPRMAAIISIGDQETQLKGYAAVKSKVVFRSHPTPKNDRALKNIVAFKIDRITKINEILITPCIQLQKVKNCWQAVYSSDVTITVQNHCTRQMPGVGIVYDGATKEMAISAAKIRAVEDGSIKAFQSMGACSRVPDKVHCCHTNEAVTSRTPLNDTFRTNIDKPSEIVHTRIPKKRTKPDKYTPNDEDDFQDPQSFAKRTSSTKNQENKGPPASKNKKG